MALVNSILRTVNEFPAGIRVLAPGADVEIDPANVISGEVQVQFIVSNDEIYDGDPANASTYAGNKRLYICGPDGRYAVPVPPGSSFVVESASKFRLRTPAGASQQNVAVLCAQLVGVRITKLSDLAPGPGGSAAGAGGGSASGTGTGSGRGDYARPGKYLD